jgi:hypothetical protein
LIGSHLGWSTIAVPGDELGFVVASGKLDERGSRLFDGVEGPHPQQVLLQDPMGKWIATGTLAE